MTLSDGRPQVVGQLRGLRLRDVIVQQLRQSIVEGKFSSGNRLPTENQMAQSMGVSRTSVREALRELEAMGLLVSRQGVGAFVCDPGVAPPEVESLAALLIGNSTIKELLEVRLAVETNCASRAAQQHTAEELAAIETLVAQMASMRQNHRAYVRLDSDFHRLIVKAGHNSIFERIMEMVSEAFADELVLTVGLPGATESSYRYHRQIAGAIAKGDARRAGAAMEQHIADVQKQVDEVRLKLARTRQDG